MSGHPVAKRRKRMQETQVSEQTSRRSGRLSYKWVVLIVAVIGTFMSALDQTIVNIAIPQIQNAFGADIHLVQWVFTGYILTQGVGTPTTAFFSDTLGLKRFYIACIALFTISSTLCEVRPELRPRFDLAGFLFVAVGMAAILYALSQAGTEGWGSTTVLGFLCGSLLALGIFVAIELHLTSRGGQPLLDLRLFSNSAFSSVTFPGLLIIGFANWQLSFITLHTPYWWLQVLLMLRGTALGLAIQPLGVVAMSEIRQAHLPLASAMMTVARSIASSLGIAVLTTLVQTHSKVHYSHLAEQVTATSPLGHLLPRISAFFMAHGASAEAARRAALQVIAGLVQRQATVLAIQDAFFFAAIFVGAALIATLLVREKRELTRRSHGMGAPAEGVEEELSASPDKAVEVL